MCVTLTVENARYASLTLCTLIRALTYNYRVHYYSTYKIQLTPARGRQSNMQSNMFEFTLYCIVLYLQPVLNPKSYDGARVLEASGRPMLVIGRSYWV